MDICRLDTPLLKRLPLSQKTLFASTWAKILDDAVLSGSEADWSSFFVFPKCILWAPVRAGRKVIPVSGTVARRLARWPTEKAQLWEAVVERSRRRELDVSGPKSKLPDAKKEKRVVSALREGDVKKALQTLIAAPIAPKTEATLNCLKKLHPTGPVPAAPAPFDAPRFSMDVVEAALRSFGPTSAAGLFGFRPRLLLQCVWSDAARFPLALTAAVNQLASGQAPAFLRRFVAGGVSIALEKSATAVRPLCCGDPLRRLVAKCFCIAGKDDINTAFRHRNYGVGCPGGVEVVAHSLRDSLERHRGSSLGLLKIDFRNAFNEISRDHFIRATCDMFPAMSAWTEWCYCAPTMLLYDHKHVIESQAGVQQGDPLGPLYFCCGIMGLVNEIGQLGVVYNKWYMDDGGIIGTTEQLCQAWELIKSRGPALGLHLNPSKCEWSWLDPLSNRPCPIQVQGANQDGQLKFVPHAEIQMLGVPLGSDSFVADFVEKKLLGRLGSTVSTLMEFEDSQSALFLLRVSFGIVRANHFMRTTPLPQWQEQAVKFDVMIRDAAEKILGFPMSDFTFAQATLTPTLGGLGLRRTVEHATGAFSASWYEAKRVSGEVWLRPPLVSDVELSQKQASFQFDEQVLQYLMDQALTERDLQRLLRVSQPHAGAFVTAVPSDVDGYHAIMRPRNFCAAIRYRLGVPVLNEEISCPMCMQTIDRFGDHATCCSKAGDLIVRHNSLRNLVNKFAADGLLNPVMEKKGILGPTSGRRPGDVSVRHWSHGKGLAIDIAVTSPFTDAHVRLDNPCESYAWSQKHAKYDEDFKGTEYDFAALVFETTGAINEEGTRVLSQLFRFAAKRLGQEFSSYCGRAWARLSCDLQRSVSQAILSRTVDLPFVPPARSSPSMSSSGPGPAFTPLATSSSSCSSSSSSSSSSRQ